MTQIYSVPVESEPQNSAELLYVNEYEIDRRYGGPEEGGWWYEVGRFIDCLGETTDEAEANRIRDDEADRLAELNEGRPSISSVLSRGQRAIYLEDERGADFPVEHPYYS